MDVAAAGTPPPNQIEAPVRTLPAIAAVSTPGLAADGVSRSLQDLASSHIGDVLGRIEHARNALDPSKIEGLLRAAVAEAGARNLPGALAAITEMARLHPEHAAELVQAEAALAPIRGEVNHLFERLALAAKSDAAGTLSAASLAVSPRDIPAIDILAAAQRFAESGTLINYVRATELGQLVLDSYPLAVKPRRWLAQARLQAMWRRVPVLVLLAGWFLLGLVGGIISLAGRYAGSGPLSATPVEIWAVGFLVLVGFQFFATIRNIRF